MVYKIGVNHCAEVSMNRIQKTAFLILAMLILVIGCADPEPVATQPAPTTPVVGVPTIEGGLVFDSVLHRSDMEMFPTFADMNSDAKPDLILGTFRGVTVQLNESANEKLSFAAAENPKRSHADYDIPWG